MKNLLLACVCALFSVQARAADIYEYTASGETIVGDLFTISWLYAPALYNPANPGPAPELQDLTIGGIVFDPAGSLGYADHIIINASEYLQRTWFDLEDQNGWTDLRVNVSFLIPFFAPPEDFNSGQFQYHGAGPSGSRGSGGPVDSLTISTVPLPAAAWLFLSALGGLVILKRKRAS